MAADDARPVLYAALPQHALIRLQGEDAVEFAHSQFTCEVRSLDPAHWTWGAHCSAKGRVSANFILWKQARELRVLLTSDLAEGFIKRLRLFVLRARVSIDSATDVVLGVQSHPDLLAALGVSQAGLAGDLQTRPDGGQLLSLSGERTLAVLPWESAELAWSELRGLSQAGSTAAWERSWIAQGEPWITAATQDQFVPQMLNMERLGGVSFTKGCYPGQEVVARAQHLGQVKRRLARFRSQVGGAVQPGSPLYAAGQSVGTVVNSAGSADLQLLAVVQTEARDAPLRLMDAQGPVLERLPLPYEAPA